MTKNKDDYAEGSSLLHVSEDDISSSSPDHNQTRVNKESRRSRIFTEKQEKVSDYNSPKFIYNKVDSIPEAERRKRIGL